ncbi:trypsin-3-like isoform X2 [Bradysia coprophila]|uniref:trypsin-3-like isoform X2 n=1 Tax=Bradysia coprophila TaxID=38358 RepID=UPI00187DAE16|nr:trypsin-3-like isoform X2 [Bradysia coprophila]
MRGETLISVSTMKSLAVILVLVGNVFGIAHRESERLQSMNSGRVVGGGPVTIESRPFAASVQHQGVHRCGGTILNDDCILTAAQCTVNIPDAVLSVRVGSAASQSGGQLFQVDYVDNHPNFNPITNANDLAVIHVIGHIHFGAAIQPIAMPAQGAGTPAGAIAAVSGWGSISEGGAFSPTLQSANVPVITNGVCNQLFGGGIVDGMICAGFVEGGAGACNGDNGSPLTFGNQVIGIVSRVEGCGRPNAPTVYTRVAYYRHWIDEHSYHH